MRICFFGASSDDIDQVYLDRTRQLGALLASQGADLVYGGGGHGLMGAFARGIKSQGGHIIAVSPHMFNKAGILYEQNDEVIFTDDLSQRKKKMEELADAYLIAPGSVGTFDELFDIYAQKKLGYTHKPIAVYNVAGFYDQLQSFLEHVAQAGFMPAEVLDLIYVSADDPAIAQYLNQPAKE